MFQSTWTKLSTLLLLAAIQTLVFANDFEVSELLAHKTLGAADPLCSVSNTVGDTCTVNLGDKRFFSDFYYETSLNLVFNNTRLFCVATGTGFPCIISLKLKQTNGASGLTLMNNSSFSGRQVIVDGRNVQVSVMDNSTIDATGQSFNTNGTATRGGGASFIGQGGNCGISNYTGSPYGFFNMLPVFTNLIAAGSQYGSMGKFGDAETAGGGRIVILADCLNLNGTGSAISANGLSFDDGTPHLDALQGGSGGYIYINTTNKLCTDYESMEAKIQAIGGQGFGGAYGGSGGVIVFDGNYTFPEEQVKANGGLAINSTLNIDGCGNGAAGTIWYRTIDRLIVDNNDIETLSQTFLYPSTPPSTWKISTPYISLDFLIKGEANVQIQGTHFQIQFGDLEMQGSVVLSILNDKPNFSMLMTKNVMISSVSTFDFSYCDKFMINATSQNNTVQLGNVWFKKALIVTALSIELSGNISVWNENELAKSYITLSSDTLYLKAGSIIASYFTLLQSTTLIKSDPGAQIISLQNNTCNTSPENSNLFSCLPFDSQQSNITAASYIQNFNALYKTKFTDHLQSIPVLVNNYTIYMYSFGEILLQGTTVSGPRIGMCANNITLVLSTLDTSGKGCLSDQGLGRGSARQICAGSGAAHGGTGGWGSAYTDTNKQDCQSRVPQPYYYGQEARYEGSGGGSGTRAGGLGGSGGGIIWMATPGSINLKSSSLLAKGMPGISANNDTVGSGGGAGGSIQFITNSLTGDGVIDISGGAGSLGGGGGGSGGRLVNHYLQSFRADMMRAQSYDWSGSFTLSGALSGENQLKANQTAAETGFDDSEVDIPIIGNNTLVIPEIIIPVANKTLPVDDGWSNTTIPIKPANKTVPVKPATKPTKKTQKLIVVPYLTADQVNSTTTKKPRKPTSKDFVPVVPTTIEKFTRFVLPANVDGSNGQAGTALHKQCFGGYSGPFCQPCEKGTYKFNYGHGLCKPCMNKPINAYYTSSAQSTSQCEYECVDGLESASTNPMCQNALELQVTKLGGPLISLIVIGAFFTICFFIWLLLIIQSKATVLRIGNKYRNVFNGVLFKSDPDEDDENTESIIGKGNLQMHDSDIWAHSYRMYLIGDNSIHYPWYISKDFPARALAEGAKEKFLNFIDKEQWTIDWTGVQKTVYHCFRMFMPYVSEEIQRAFRRKHFVQLGDQLFDSFEESFWSERGGRTLRLSSNTQGYQLAYVDFLDFQNNKQEYQGPKLPLTLLLAGNGSFDTPYYLNFMDDPLAKSLVYLNQEVLKAKLPIFFENLNTLLAKLSFFKFNRMTMRDLDQIIEWVEMGNKSLFNPLDCKATLYIFENFYQETDNGSFRQKRRSLPLDPLVFESFQDLFKELIRFVQGRLLTQDSEIRMGLVFKPFNLDKKRKLQDRVKKMLQQKVVQIDRMAFTSTSASSVSLLFNSDDEDSKVGKSKKKSNNTSALINESQESQIFSGDEVKTIKIIDRSKRAFDISNDATKAFEMALQEERGGCKYRMLRFRGVLFSLWLLLLKHHGKPPGQRGLYCLFLTFAALLSVDIMLSFVIYIHVFNPIINLWTFGLPWVFVIPAVTLIAPFWGLIASMAGSPGMLKTYSSMNATIFLVNYPLTLFYMLYMRQPAFYIVTILTLMLNKVFINFAAAKVTQHLINPSYGKNQAKLEKRHRNLVSARVDVVTRDVSSAERAALLVASGPPSESLKSSFQGETVSSAYSDSDEEKLSISDEDGQDYGIVSKRQVNRQGK